MLARGVPLIVVSRQLGHANPNITAQVYAHLLSDSQLDDAAAVFDPAPATETLRDTLREIEAAAERRMDSGHLSGRAPRFPKPGVASSILAGGIRDVPA